MLHGGYGPFNTREIASALWIFAFLTWALWTQPKLRHRVSDLLRILAHPKILGFLLVMAAYTTGAVSLLAVFGLWTPSLLKDTIFWFCATALALWLRFGLSTDARTMFSQVATESLTIIIVLEFLLNTYTFSLPVEFILVPFLTVLAGFIVVADSDETSAKAAGCLKALQALIGIAILAIALIRALINLDALGTTHALQTFALPPLLTLLFLPCLYCIVLATKYDSIFSRLNRGPEKSTHLMRYARRKLLMKVGLHIEVAQRILSEHAWDLQQAQSEEDIDRLLDCDTEG